MFSCTTRFNCDICGTGYISTCERMSGCISRDKFRYGYCQITHMNVSLDFYCGYGEKKDKE